MTNPRGLAASRLGGCLATLLIGLAAGGGEVAADDPLPWETWRDLHRLAEVHGGHQALLRSSHCTDGCRFDRHSAGDWRYLYVEGDEGVIFEEAGAGAISRLWMTMGRGVSQPLDEDVGIRIWVDGAATPVVDLPLPRLFDGSTPPFVPPLAGHRLGSSGGNYSYVPIAYRDGCRVALVGAHDRTIWYQINFHRLADAAGVVSFTGREDLGAFADLLSLAGQDPWPPGSGAVTEGTLALAPGGELALLEAGGPGVVTALELGLDPSLWREIELRLVFDGRVAAALPLADFFAVGRGGPLPTRSLLVGRNAGGGLYCYFPMPFFRFAELSLAHRGPETAAVDYSVRVSDRPPSPASGFFEAALRVDEATAAGTDFPVLALTGHGKVAGLFLELGSIAGTSQGYLEGDERWFIDGSPHPAVYGTGVEDFFNGGFYFDQGPLSRALHGAPYVTLDDGGARFTAAYRLLLTEAVTFTGRLVAGLESGPTGDTSMRARAVTWAYRRPAPLLYLWDRLDLGRAADRALHDYEVGEPHSFAELASLFEGEPPAAAVATGVYRPPGAATFVLRAPPSATRLRLRRRLDAGVAGQRAAISVDGRPAGRFPVVGADDDRRWREIDVDLAAGAPGSPERRFSVVSEEGTFTAFRYELWADDPGEVFADGFESGDADVWSHRRP